MKNIKTLLITALTATMLTIPQALAQETSNIVNQGDMVTNNKSNCTIGYIDTQHRRAYTAQHCFNNGETVYLPDRETVLGVNYHFDDTVESDISYILLDKNITTGHNIYSGDNVSRYWEEGDQVSNYSRKLGSSSQFAAINGFNFPDLRDNDNQYYREGVSTTLPGDSGGPVWTKNGLIGVIKGTVTVANNMIYTAFPEDTVINSLPDGQPYQPSKPAKPAKPQVPTIKEPKNSSLSSVSSSRLF